MTGCRREFEHVTDRRQLYEAHDPIERELLMTRRQLFGRGGAGHRHGGAGDAAPGGGIRGRRLRAPRCYGCAELNAPLRAEGEAGDLPVPVRRAVAHRPVRLQAAAARSTAAIELPDSVRMGQRITGMTSGQKNVPVRRRHLQVRAARQERRLVQRAAAAHGVDRGRHLRRQVDAHRGDQPRPGHHLHPDRLPAAGPAEHRLLAVLRSRAARTRTCPPTSF